MRVLIVVVILAALGLGAYFLGQGAPEDMEDTARAPQEAAGEAVEEAEGVADDAADTAAGATDGATDAADAADSAVEAANDAANAVLDAATVTPEASPRLDEVLTRDGFDFDAAIAAIERSDVSEMTKRAARAALAGARDNPELLPAAIEQARTILGLE